MSETRAAGWWAGGAAVACGVLADFLVVAYRQLVTETSFGLNRPLFYGLTLVTLVAAAALTWRAVRESGRASRPGTVVAWVLFLVSTAIAGVVTAQVVFDLRTILGLANRIHYLRTLLIIDAVPVAVGIVAALAAARLAGDDSRERRVIRTWSLALGLAFAAAQALAALLSLPPVVPVRVLVSPGYRPFCLAVVVVALLLCWVALRRAPGAGSASVPGLTGATGATLTLFSLAMASTALRRLALTAVSQSRLPAHSLRTILVWVLVGAVFAVLAANGLRQHGTESTPELVDHGSG